MMFRWKWKRGRQDAAQDADGDPGQPTIAEAIREQASEAERPFSADLTLRKILGGDFLTARTIRNQLGLIVLIVLFTLVYVSNRYKCQKDIHQINELKEKLKDSKYKAMASSSEITELSRESNVLDMLKSTGDSTLKAPQQPPYIVVVPKND